MSKILLGLICGVAFGIIDVLIMIPLELEDKRAAMLGAFINRFSIGVVVGAVDLPLATWLSGLVFGILLSLPDAIITKVYVPIIAIGAVGGGVIGLIVGAWGA
jgi:hypothetical protein